MIIYLVTVLYNSEGVLPGFLESLNRQEGIDWKLYAIDNASSDGGVAYLKKQDNQRIEIIENKENVGVAAANNQGIIRALAENAEWILILNNDTTFDKAAIYTLFKSACNNKAKIIKANN